MTNIEFSLFNPSSSVEVVELYLNVFSTSEGVNEGRSVATLVSNLINTTNENDLIGFVSKQDDKIVGCIFFSRFNLAENRTAFLLSPVAVSTQFQGKHIGQELISYGLRYLANKGVNFALTYGDPEFYSKVGFKKIKESDIAPPFKLSQPIGWLAQTLDGNSKITVKGSTQCVEAFNDPIHW